MSISTTLRRPFAGIPSERLRIAGTCAVALFAIIFPLIHGDDADIDSVANALSYAALALGLNIVVGMAGLLDLGYAAFFAIGAYTYGILSSFQLQPDWSSFWEPFAWLGLVARMPGQGTVDVVHTTPVVLAGRTACRSGSRPYAGSCSARRPCACAAITWPSSRSASARSCPSSPATGRA